MRFFLYQKMKQGITLATFPGQLVGSEWWASPGPTCLFFIELSYLYLSKLYSLPLYRNSYPLFDSFRSSLLARLLCVWELGEFQEVFVDSSISIS